MLQLQAVKKIKQVIIFNIVIFFLYIEKFILRSLIICEGNIFNIVLKIHQLVSSIGRLLQD